MELNIAQLMDELVEETIKSVKEDEDKKPDVDYGKAAMVAFERSKQHLKQSKIGLEAYLDLLDKNENKDLVSISDYEDIELPMSKEHTLAVIEEIDGILLRILAGRTTDVLEVKRKQKKLFPK